MKNKRLYNSRASVITICMLLFIQTIYITGLSGCNIQEPTRLSQEFANAGFEEGEDNWTFNVNGNGNYEIKTSETDAYEGSKSLYCSAEGHCVINICQEFTGQESGYYYFTAYMKNSEESAISYLYGNGSCQSPCITAIPVSDEWVMVTVRGIKVSDDGNTKTGISIELNSDSYIWVDNCKFEREQDQSSAYENLFGGDISRITCEEDNGAIYYTSDGIAEDPVKILADNGIKTIKLELHNTPGKGNGTDGGYIPEYYQTTEDILNIAKRAKEYDMSITLAFSYSDYWGNEAIPSEWKQAIESMNFYDALDYLENAVYEYTREVLEQMDAQGTMPDYVALGGEIQGGILLPYGNSWEKEDSFKNLAKLLNAGARAVRETSEDTKIVLHLGGAGNNITSTDCGGTFDWFFSSCETYNVDYDVIGGSYYPFWAETLTVSDLVEWADIISERFDKDILIMETGYNYSPYREDGYVGQLSNNGAYEEIYESSPDGQKNFLKELFNGIKSVKNGRCIGAYYWDPIFVVQSGVGSYINETNDTVQTNVVTNTTLFDFEHRALPALDIFTMKENEIHKVYYYCEESGPLVKYNNKMCEMNEEGSNWYSFEFTYNETGLEFIDGEGNSLITLSDYENNDLYGKLLEDYYIYLYDDSLYENEYEAVKKYYIVGSTTDWSAKDAGIFSNYWAIGDEWLDEMQLVSPGVYKVTLGTCKEGTEYEFCVYADKDWSKMAMPRDFSFVADKEGKVTFTYYSRINLVTWSIEN
ncbi:MAG: glycosyl hydrolase 53 family protein [Eubacterium sp.]